MHGGDRGIDTRLDGDTGDRRDRAEGVDTHRHLLALGLAHVDLDQPRGLVLRTRGGAVAGRQQADDHDSTDQGERRHP